MNNSGKGMAGDFSSRGGGGGGHSGSGGPGRTEDSIALLSRQDSAARRVRIIHLLRRTFGDELERLPQFAAIVGALKSETVQYVECATQTNGGLSNGALQSNGQATSVSSSSGGIVEVYQNAYQTSGSVRHRINIHTGGLPLSSSSAAAAAGADSNQVLVSQSTNSVRSAGKSTLALLLMMLIG